jgi:16S rRNA processing protein RimM
MKKEDCFVLGKVTKPHGYKGAVVVFIDADEPSAYAEIEAIWVEIGDRLIPHFIDAMRPHNTADKFVVDLEGIDSEAKAKSISGCTAYLPSRLLPKLDDSAFYLHEVDGWTVATIDGEHIGSIRKVLDYAMYPILEVHAEAHGKDILIPLPAQLEIQVDRAAQSLRVELPEGLLETYLGSDGASDEAILWDGDETD